MCFRWYQVLTFLILIYCSAVYTHALGSGAVKCEHFNESCIEKGGGDACIEIQECQLVPGTNWEHAHNSDKVFHCYVLWSNSSDKGPQVRMKGCFQQSNDCAGGKRCVDTKNNTKDFYFCCCDGDLCNSDFAWEPVSVKTVKTNSPEKVTDNNSYIYIVIYVVMGLLTVIGVGVICFCYRSKKTSYFNEIPTSEPNLPPSPSPDTGMRPIQLVEIKARGRFGAVWKANYKSDVVAVKVFPIQDKQSWMSEQQIFKLPRMDHNNILHYIGAEKRGDNLQAEFWLITAYHELGSLCDFLKANTVTFQQLCKIAESMSRGLMHLHEEVPPSKGESFKPAIAHRDFKSKNVLLKTDLTACIADFGLALVFQPGKPCGDTHGQVGTRRYMAPEVLEGAINFSRDAFLRIDMYACGLVLWELASRCSAQIGPISEYRLPFEEEVGLHPSLEDMQDLVVHKKQRPVLRNDWKSHPGLLVLCDTMDECWDHDAEARLSASCVMQRIASRAKLNLQPLLINDTNV